MALESFLSSSVNIDLDIGYSGVEYAQTSKLSGLGSCAMTLGEVIRRFKETEEIDHTCKISLK